MNYVTNQEHHLHCDQEHREASWLPQCYVPCPCVLPAVAKSASSHHTDLLQGLSLEGHRPRLTDDDEFSSNAALRS